MYGVTRSKPQGFVSKVEDPNELIGSARYYRVSAMVYDKGQAQSVEVAGAMPLATIGGITAIAVDGTETDMVCESYIEPMTSGKVWWKRDGGYSGRTLHRDRRPLVFRHVARSYVKRIRLWLGGVLAHPIMIESSADGVNWVTVDIISTRELADQVGSGLIPRPIIRDVINKRPQPLKVNDKALSRYWRVIIEDTHGFTIRNKMASLKYIDLKRTTPAYSMRTSGTISTPQILAGSPNAVAADMLNGTVVKTYPTGLAVDFFNSTVVVPDRLEMSIDQLTLSDSRRNLTYPSIIRVLCSEDGVQWSTHRAVEYFAPQLNVVASITI